MNFGKPPTATRSHAARRAMIVRRHRAMLEREVREMVDGAEQVVDEIIEKTMPEKSR